MDEPQKPRVLYTPPPGEEFCPCEFFTITILLIGGKEMQGIRTAPDNRSLRNAIQEWLDNWPDKVKVSGWSVKRWQP